MFVDCEQASSSKLYELLINAVVPRPIAWVSTRSKAGIDNLAPFSFFNVFSAKPPILGFSPGLKRQPGSSELVMKDTLKNVIETGEFVVNIVSMELAEKMVQSSDNYAENVSEFEVVGLTPGVSSMIAPPRVKEAHVNLECKLFKIIDLGSSKLVLGQIVCAFVNDEILSDGIIDVSKLRPVARLGGDLYSAVTAPFSINRP